MKMSPEYTKAQTNMQPGVITAQGFLGEDDRLLVDIIEADEQQMASLGLDFDDVAQRLRHLIDEGRKGLDEPVTVDDKWIVQTYEARGFLASPFEDGIFRKINAQIELAPEGEPTGKKLLVSELSLHLLQQHHFLQGKGSPYRLEPHRIKEVLDL